MRYETQIDLLKLLHQLSQHFAASALSLSLDRSFDAARTMTVRACVRE